MTQWYPYSVNIELTLACNLRCIHCGATAGRPRRDELTAAELRRVFAELAELGCDEVCLLGGEPLVRRDWATACEDVGAAGLGLVLITNGMLVDEDVVARLAGFEHLRRVGVSLDAADPEVHDRIRNRQGSHARAMNALCSMRDAGIEVGAITTLMQANFDQLEPLRDALLGQDITWQIQLAAAGGERFDPAGRLTPAQFYEVGRFIDACRREHTVAELPVAGSHDVGYHSQVLGPTGELPDWPGCGAGLYTLGIMSDGSVKGCLSQHDDFVEDNLRERSLVDIWNDPERFARNRRFTTDQLEGFCRECPHGATCRAGCSNVCYTVTGRGFDNPYCFYRIEREGGA